MESYKEWRSQLTRIREYPGERYAFKRIKSDAAAARRSFEIPFDWFVKQCHEPCHYCGRVDRNNISIKSRSLKVKGFVVENFKYNGLDRVDNAVGYTVDNCVPCCAICNRGKNSMGYNDFIEYISDLIKFQTSGDNNDYTGRHVRDVPLPVSGRRGEAGDEVKTQFASGGYVPEDRVVRWNRDDGYIIPRALLRDLSEPHPIRIQKEEPDQD